MAFLFFILGCCALGFGLVFIGAVKSDIQIQIVVALVMGGLNLLGIALLMARR